MTTQSLPTPSETPNDETPEERRSARLLVFLLVPLPVVPAVVGVIALIAGVDPFPWHVVGRSFSAAVLAVSFVGLAVLMIPRLARHYGAPSLAERDDERERAIFYRALWCSTMATAVVLMASLFVTILVDALRPALPVVSLLLAVQGAALWLGVIFFSRRT